MLAIFYLLLVFVFGDAICRRFFPFVSTPHRVATGFLAGLLLATWITYAGAYLFAGTSYPMLAGNIVFTIIAIAVSYLLNRNAAPAASTTIDPEKTNFVRADWIVVCIFFVVAVVMAYSTFTMNEGTIRIAHHQSSDFGSTASIMQSFAVGHNFPTEYPHFAGDKIRYHFLFYFQAGNLEYLGFSPATANNTLSILTLLSLLVLVMTLGSVLFKSRTAGRIGAILFYFHGTLAYIPFYLKQGSLSAVWERLWKMQDFLSSGFPYRGEDWGVWSQVVYLNQRHLASSIGIFLLVVVFLSIRQRERYEAKISSAPVSEPIPESDTDSETDRSGDEDAADEESIEPVIAPPEDAALADDSASLKDTPDTAAAETDGTIALDDEPPTVAETAHGVELEHEEAESPNPSDIQEEKTDSRETMVAWAHRLAPYAFCGLLLGLMPLWNGAVFAGAAGVLAIMFFALPLRREMIAVAVVSGLIALPQVIFLRSGLAPVQYSTWYFGYTLTEPTIGKMLYYLAFTFGFKWIFIAIALIFANRLQRLMIVAITALLIMATCFQFSEEILANHKFFNVWVVLINVAVGFGIVKLWNLMPSPGAIFARLLTIVMVFLIVIGGVIDLFPVKNSFWVDYRFQGDPLVDWVRNNTDPKSIWLSHRYVNHGILMAGRRLYYGHPYYAWGAGYPVNERDVIYRKMLESRDINEVFSLIKENRIDYVAIDNIVRSGADFIKKNNEQLLQAYFPVVFSDTENKYDNLKIYKVPETLGPPDPSFTIEATPTPSPSAALNAFTGGEGAGFGQFSRPRGIAVDSKGDIYVADTGNSRIQKFDSEGKFLASFGKPGTAEGELKEPNGIAVDDGGRIFVTDAFNHKLVMLDPNGLVLREWKGPDPGFYGPRDIAFGPNKKLYIVDQGRTRIVRFDPATDSFTAWGSAGPGEGQFHESTGIGVSDKHVYVADNGNNRVQLFDLEGAFVRMWEVQPWERYVWNYPDVAFDAKAKRLLIANSWKQEILITDMEGNVVDAPLKATLSGPLENPTAMCFSEIDKNRRLLVLNTSGNKISKFDF